MPKTRRTRKWHKKLTLKELAHVNEWCGGTLEGIKQARENQKRQKAEVPDSSEPCWDCRTIAVKLGLE